MSLVYKKASRKNLSNIDVFYEDNSLKSADFFRIVYLPEVLARGKNMLKLSAHPSNLIPDTEILIDIRDSQGNPIYFEIPDFIEEDKSRVISIWIYHDREDTDLNTTNGDATITLVGTSKVGPDGKPVPKKWRNKPNVRWKYEVNVDRDRKNITPIIFDPKDLPILIPSESIETYTRVPTGSDSNTVERITQTGSARYLYRGSTPIIETLDGTEFNTEMFTYEIQLGDFVEPATPVSRYENPINDTSYTASVTSLLSSTKAVVDLPFTTEFQSRDELIHTYDSITAASYSIEYFSTGSNVPVTESLQSFVTLRIDNLDPIAGVVDRLKIFIRSLSFDSDFELINDIQVPYTGSISIKTPLNEKFTYEPNILKVEYISSDGQISRTISFSDVFVFEGGNLNNFPTEFPGPLIINPGGNDTGSTTIDGPTTIWENESGSTSIDGPIITVSSSDGSYEFEISNLLLTASNVGNVITFTKANGDQFDLTIPTGSGGGLDYIDSVFYETGSIRFEGVGLAFDSVINISDLTASLVNENTFNQFTSSYYEDSASFAELITSASVDTSSFMITGSVVTNVLTFEKGDGSTFDLIVDTGSNPTLQDVFIFSEAEQGTNIVTASLAVPTSGGIEFNNGQTQLKGSDYVYLSTVNGPAGNTTFGLTGFGTWGITPKPFPAPGSVGGGSFMVNSTDFHPYYTFNGFTWVPLITADDTGSLLQSSVTGSFVVTASLSGSSGNIIEFEKAGGDLFYVTIDTGSGGGGGGSTDTSSLLVTASAVDNIITFEKGDGSTFDVTLVGGLTTESIESGSVYYRVSQVSHGFTVGEVVSHSGSVWILAANDVDGRRGSNGVVATVYNPNEFKVLTKGLVNYSSSISQSEWGYLSSIPGTVQQSEPSGLGIQLIYEVINDGLIYVDIGDFFVRTGSAIPGTLNITEPLSGLIEDVIEKTYDIFSYSPYNGFIKWVGAEMKSGSCDVDVLINTSSIASGVPFGAITGSFTKVDVSGSAINFSEGDKIKLRVTNVSSSPTAVDLNWVISVNRSVL